MPTNGTKTKRTLKQRLDATAADYDERIRRIAREKAIALGKLKANAKASELHELDIVFDEDLDIRAFAASKAPPVGEKRKDG